MKKQLLAAALASLAVLAAWSSGRREPAPTPTPAPPPAPTYVDIVRPYTTLSFDPQSGYIRVDMTVKVRHWSNGTREFVGSPSFQFLMMNPFPYAVMGPIAPPTVQVNSKWAIAGYALFICNRVDGRYGIPGDPYPWCVPVYQRYVSFYFTP